MHHLASTTTTSSSDQRRQRGRMTTTSRTVPDEDLEVGTTSSSVMDEPSTTPVTTTTMRHASHRDTMVAASLNHTTTSSNIDRSSSEAVQDSRRPSSASNNSSITETKEQMANRGSGGRRSRIKKGMMAGVTDVVSEPSSTDMMEESPIVMSDRIGGGAKVKKRILDSTTKQEQHLDRKQGDTTKDGKLLQVAPTRGPPNVNISAGDAFVETTQPGAVRVTAMNEDGNYNYYGSSFMSTDEALHRVHSIKTVQSAKSDEFPPHLEATLVEEHYDEEDELPRKETLSIPTAEASAVVPEDELVNREELRQSRRRIIRIAAIVLLVIFVILGGVIAYLVTSTKGKEGTSETATASPSTAAPSLMPTPSPTLSPSRRPTVSPAPTPGPTSATKFRLISTIQSRSPESTFDDPSSSQQLALDWLLVDTYSQELILKDEDDVWIQRFGLATLYFAATTDGQQVTEASSIVIPDAGWLSSTNECLWQPSNVECDGTTGLVMRIDLEGSDLNGTIPLELILLSNSLMHLDLDENTNLIGSIPTQLGSSMTALTYLGLRDCGLAGEIPSELGSLTDLTLLSLVRNDLTGSLPTELGLLTSLTQLEVNNRDLTGSIPSEIGSLTQLQWLSVSNSDLAGSTIPTEMGELTALRDLFMSMSGLEGNIPSEIGLMTSLTAAVMNENRLEGPIPSELGLLTALQYISLARNRLTGEFPSDLRQMTSIQGMELWGNVDLSGTVPSELCLLGSVDPNFGIVLDGPHIVLDLEAPIARSPCLCCSYSGFSNVEVPPPTAVDVPTSAPVGDFILV